MKSKNIGYNLQKVIIREGDIFLAHINVKEMMKFKEEMKVLLLSDIKMNQQELSGKHHVIVEAIVSQQSPLIGKTIKEFDFRNRFGSFVLALKRQEELLREKVAHIHLKFSVVFWVLIFLLFHIYLIDPSNSKYVTFHKKNLPLNYQ